MFDLFIKLTAELESAKMMPKAPVLIEIQPTLVEITPLDKTLPITIVGRISEVGFQEPLPGCQWRPNIPASFCG